jgi:hypothetical protein
MLARVTFTLRKHSQFSILNSQFLAGSPLRWSRCLTKIEKVELRIENACALSGSIFVVLV